jgi:hypothetical protein
MTQQGRWGKKAEKNEVVSGVLEEGVPVSLLIGVIQRRELDCFVVILSVVDTVGLIFITVPGMIVVVLLVVIGANGCLRVGAQRGGHECQGSQQEGAQ